MKNELDDELKEIEEQIKSMPREKVAYCIIKMFMQTESPSPRLTRNFHRWLLSPENGEAKEQALAQCFDEYTGEPAMRVIC